MGLDSNFIEHVRNGVNIIHVIESYVQLRKQGQNYVALCPFHGEKTPSFSASETKQIFKCFGCGVGGDVFSFIQQIERLTFVEAVKHVAERAGIPLPEASPDMKRREDERGRLMSVMVEASRFFQRHLAANSPARDYLAGRKISDATTQQFGIGFAPPGSQLLETFRSKGVPATDLVKCGLVNQNDSGEYYDKFRSRVIFPIRNLSGKTIAFGGRVLGDGRPKYLNSPETPIYHKGDHLFGLDSAKDEIRQRDFAILVEGYFDCVVPYQFGIKNAIASLGTSLTEGQVKLLGRFTRRVVVNFDPDSAGLAAAMRSIDLFLEQGFSVNVVRLPGNEDPDSFILANGPQAYMDVLKGSQPYLDFLLEHFMNEEPHPFSPSGKQSVTSKILPYLAKIPSRVARSEYVSRVSTRLRMNEDTLILELRKFARTPSVQQPLKASLAAPVLNPAEKALLLAVLDEEFRELALQNISLEMFSGLQSEQVFKTIFDMRNRNEEISVLRLRDLLESHDAEWFERISLDTALLQFTAETIKGSADALRDLQFDRLSRQIQEEIEREETLGVTSERLDELLRRKEALRREQQR